MQYLILVLVVMTIVIYIREKAEDTEKREQPELVMAGWKRFIGDVKSICGKKSEETLVQPQDVRENNDSNE